jgi:hypothetical protein
MEMNLQLHHVVSDITGVTGMRIIRAIQPRQAAFITRQQNARRSAAGAWAI